VKFASDLSETISQLRLAYRIIGLLLYLVTDLLRDRVLVLDHGLGEFL
jgi:hypothetical protein